MGQHWSRIKSLWLCASPSQPFQAGTSLEVLAAFGKVFPPTLEKLGLFFTIPGSDVLRRPHPKGPGLQNVRVLNTGRTRPPQNFMDVALFLSSLLPEDSVLLTGVQTSGLVNAFPEGDQGLQDPDWTEVKRTMAFVKLRVG
ncbi:hypothetical protein FRB90_002461 [Tulasnella sp. 427]|nr:hypothetical protein FRB90_002461 [Tulasnella sp. 427]